MKIFEFLLDELIDFFKDRKKKNVKSYNEKGGVLNYIHNAARMWPIASHPFISSGSGSSEVKFGTLGSEFISVLFREDLSSTNHGKTAQYIKDKENGMFRFNLLKHHICNF